MATKTKLDSAQATKPKKATTSSPDTNAIHGKRTTRTITRSSSNVGKSSGATTASNVPGYQRPTQSSRTDSPNPGGIKETLATKPSPALTRKQSFDKPPQVAQLQRPRSPTIKSTSTVSSSSRPTELSKSLSSSSRSRTTNARPAELMKSKTMPKPGASSRPGSASGSLSRFGSTVKTLKKSPVPSLSSKRQTVSDSNKQHITSQAEPQVVMEEEKATPPPPIEDGSVERDVIVVEEDHVQDEEEEVVVVSTVKEEEIKEVDREAAISDDSPPPDIDTSEKPSVEEEEEEEGSLDIEFHQEEEVPAGVNILVDEGEISSSEGEGESGGSSKPPQPEEYDGEERKSADAEETPPLSSTETLPPSEEKGHSTEVVVTASSIQTPPKQSEMEESETIVPSKLAMRPPALDITTHRSSVGKKDSPMYNDVIEETASKLLEKRKNKVRALVGAFETVISLQE